MLGMGRALGETMAVTFVIGNTVLSITNYFFLQALQLPQCWQMSLVEAAGGLHFNTLFALGFSFLLSHLWCWRWLNG